MCTPAAAQSASRPAALPGQARVRLLSPPLLALLVACLLLAAASTAAASASDAGSAVVELTDDSFERLTQASTGATTGQSHESSPAQSSERHSPPDTLSVVAHHRLLLLPPPLHCVQATGCSNSTRRQTLTATHSAMHTPRLRATQRAALLDTRCGTEGASFAPAGRQTRR